jgi:hypothetical protein
MLVLRKEQRKNNPEYNQELRKRKGEDFRPWFFKITRQVAETCQVLLIAELYFFD